VDAISRSQGANLLGRRASGERGGCPGLPGAQSQVSARGTRGLLSLESLSAERCGSEAGLEEDPPPQGASSPAVGVRSWVVGDVGLGPSG